MILWLVDRFSNLSRRHYLVVVVTIVVPVLFPTVMGYFEIERLWFRVTIDVIVILVWAMFVVVVVSRLVERDAGEVHRLVADRVGPVAGQLERLREEHGNSMADMRLQVEDLERRAQSALRDLGVDLGPRVVNLRGTATAGAAVTSARLSVSGGSRWARIRGWVRRARRRAWEIIWGQRHGG